MAKPELGPEELEILEQVLGHLNFSSGAEDVQFLSNLNELFRVNWKEDAAQRPLWERVLGALTRRLNELSRNSAAFRDCAQAQGVLRLVAEHVLPEYLNFHQELLFHQTAASLFNSFFVGRVFEAVLRQGPPWEEQERITSSALRQLNDYIGHRPVAALESRRMEPYPQEWVRPIPLYVRGAGVACGPTEQVVRQALELLEQTDEDLLHSAYFDPSRLDELAIDPRAYDFDHPVNKRPNYHFGQWDPHLIDNQGYFRRFVVQQVTMDALMARLESDRESARPKSGGIDAQELTFEAAAVLAGTILMAAGISGAGPESHDSNVTLATLLPTIARYRDAFYERMYRHLDGQHAKRLFDEAAERRQPFGGARQALNARLARCRASQLEHVHLAKIFAGMGYPEEALDQANVVATSSARLLCKVDCSLTIGHRALDNADLEEAVARIDAVLERVRTGIECGAIVDPWNILGFDAQFSLFPALENSIRDHRVDELLALMEQIFAFCSRVWSEAAARDQQAICQQVQSQYLEFAQWWRQFAAHEVSSVEAIDSMDAYHAAEHVANALNLWHKAGAAAGDVKFWAPHADIFDSPRAYALVIQALLDQGDFVGSMALLIHWLGQAERIGLERGDSSFCQLAERWLRQLFGSADAQTTTTAETWKLIRRFFDYLEANADEYWSPPHFAVAGGGDGDDRGSSADADAEGDEGEEDNIFGAAYEDMVYTDSADDGVDSQIFETESDSHDELLERSKPVAVRLSFLHCLARLWKLTAIRYRLAEQQIQGNEEAKLGGWEAVLARWGELASGNADGLSELLQEVSAYRIPAPSGDHDSMVEYDRRRMVKESLLERIIATSIETDNARRMLLAAVCTPNAATACRHLGKADVSEEEKYAIVVLSGVLRNDHQAIRKHWKSMLDSLGQKPLLYVPISKGGNPRSIVETRARQQTIQDLLAWLPRRGLFVETCQLIDLARVMERSNPIGPGAVTEFDELFKIGYKALVECCVESSQHWRSGRKKNSSNSKKALESKLVSFLEQLTEAQLVSWLAHSRTLRLSVLERTQDEAVWAEVVDFIQTYGGELFSQRFLNLGNLRAILHQGVGRWLRQLMDSQDDYDLRLMDDLDGKLELEDAAENLTLILEAIVENYGEYRDYNSTTTQSDQGNMLYTLLDFLRLRTRYDRVCWNLKPVIWAHEILVRRGMGQAAKMWRRALAQRINQEAEMYLKQLSALQKKYAMRMPTVADRLAERFIRPMAIDRICALVEPAIEESRNGGKTKKSFELLAEETEILTREPTGVGLDVPAWLVALEDEVERARQPLHQRNDDFFFRTVIPMAQLSDQEIERQLDAWCNRNAKP